MSASGTSQPAEQRPPWVDFCRSPQARTAHQRHHLSKASSKRAIAVIKIARGISPFGSGIGELLKNVGAQGCFSFAPEGWGVNRFFWVNYKPDRLRKLRY
jgi:hypothetical protein